MNKAKIDIEAAKFRKKAEEIMLKRNLKKNAEPISELEALKLVHELQVREIELELQNKALIEAKEAAEIATEKYIELYDFALFGFFTLSKEGEILSLNFNGAKMMGKNRSELIDRRFGLFVSDDSKPIFNSFCEKISSGKAKESCEVELLNNSSSPTYLHLSGVIKENDDQLLIMALDITSRKIAEIEQIKDREKAEASETKFRELFSNVTDAIFIYNPDTFEILDANKATSELYGYGYDELIGMSCLKFSAELEKSKSVAKLIKTERKVNVKLRHHKKKDGSDVFVELSNYNILVNGKNIIYSVCHDITDIKKTELELSKAKEEAEASERQLKLIADNFVNGMIYQVAMLDENRRQFNYINQNVKELYGCTVEEAKEDANLIYGKLHPDDLIGLIEKEKEALRNMSIFEAEARAITPDGNIRWAYYISKPRVINGIVCWDGIEIDITERKQMELELRKAKEKAEESEEKFKLLNRLTSEMLLLQDTESIYKFIAENLQKYHPNTIVLNVSIDESKQESRLEVISGVDNSLLAKVIKISGFNPIGKTYKLTDIHNNYFRSGNFIEFDGGLAEFSASEFPAGAARVIEKLIGLHKIYTIGINKDDGLLAALHFFTFNNQVITDGNFIEVFVKQAGLVLQKKLDEKALINAKEEAEESEITFRKLFEDSSDPILLLDNTGVFVECNQAALNILKTTREQFLFHPPGNISPEYQPDGRKSQEGATEMINLAHKKGGHRFDWTHINAEGDEFIVEISLMPILIKGQTMLHTTWRDITERKHAEEVIRLAKEKAEESEQRLKLATSSGELGIWDWNVKENIMVWDERMFQLYGIEKTAFVNTVDAWVNGLHPEDKDRAMAESNEALAGGKDFDTIFRVLHPNGTVKYLKADAVVIRDSSKKAVRMIGINKDVTESILAEQSLRISETQLKKLNATKDKLFSIIAHDLRSPFNSILGLSKLLSENAKEFDIEETKKYSDFINSAAQKSLILLDNLLNWAKSQTGNLAISAEKITLSTVIQEVIQLKKLLAESKNITLNYTPSDEIEVYSDENMLKLVLRNLISNAIKFTKTGGEINISAISVQDHVEVSVSDNGVGMSDEMSKKLFDTSTNTTSPGTANEKGSGLGLILCKEFVEKLGGNIWVESEEGVGSTFYFTIPFQNSKNNKTEDAIIEPIQQTSLSNKKLKILVAEDDEVSFEHLSIIIKDVAREIIHAKTGIEAVDLCKKNADIDVILMDIKMPELNGYEACRRIREFNKEVVIIAQTAYALPGDENKAIAAGCNDYITKPIQKKVLLKKIQTQLKTEK